MVWLEQHGVASAVVSPFLLLTGSALPGFIGDVLSTIGQAGLGFSVMAAVIYYLLNNNKELQKKLNEKEEKNDQMLKDMFVVTKEAQMSTKELIRTIQELRQDIRDSKSK